MSAQSLRTSHQLNMPVFERDLSMKQRYALGTDPARIFMGSNPRGNSLTRPDPMNTMMTGQSGHLMPMRLKTLPHQIVSSTPFHKDPFKLAQMKMARTLNEERKNSANRYGVLAEAGVGPNKTGPNPIFTAQGTGQGAMRGHTDSRKSQTLREMASTVANNTNLNRERVFN